jgi:prepilin-type N-terminal cleavage/methylation domain-containing protein
VGNLLVVKRLSSNLLSRRKRLAQAVGFTLIELLVVLGMMTVLAALAIPAITSLDKANQLGAATSTISLLLEQGRTYAMANNTYVFVCLEETDASTATTQAQNPGTGRVAVQLFSSIDGTMNLAASNLKIVSRLQVFENLDLPGSLNSNTGTLNGRPAASYVMGNGNFPNSATAISSGRFTFSKIIALDAQGTLHLPTIPPQSGLQYVEIDLQPANGTVVSGTSNNLSAIQIDGLTGMVTTFRS